MEKINWTAVIVAIIGFSQVALAIYFARRVNKATAEKEEAIAGREDANRTEAIGSSYSTLVASLEIRLARLEKSYDDLCAEYEADKIAWALERAALFQLIDDLGGKK